MMSKNKFPTFAGTFFFIQLDQLFCGGFLENVTDLDLFRKIKDDIFFKLNFFPFFCSKSDLYVRVALSSNSVTKVLEAAQQQTQKMPQFRPASTTGSPLIILLFWLFSLSLAF